MNFLIKAVVIGLAVAFLVVWWNPTLLGAHTAVAPMAGATPDAAQNAASSASLGAAPSSLSTGQAGAASSAPIVMQSFADAVARAAPAVVNIYTARVVTERTTAAPLNQLFGDYWPSYRQRIERSLGSGVIVERVGTIVTNQHVIAARGFDPGAARRRPHRRCDHRRPGP